MSKQNLYPEKYAVGFNSTGGTQNVVYSLWSLSIQEVDIVSGAIVITQHPVFFAPEEKRHTRVVVLPLHLYDNIEYRLVDIRSAILAAFGGSGNRGDFFEWLDRQKIDQMGQKWRFETSVLGEKAVFVQGYSAWLDEVMEEYLGSTEEGASLDDLGRSSVDL